MAEHYTMTFRRASDYEPLIQVTNEKGFFEKIYDESYILNDKYRSDVHQSIKDWWDNLGSIDNYNPEGTETIPGQMMSNFWDSMWESLQYHIGNGLTTTYEALYSIAPEILTCVTILFGVTVMVTGMFKFLSYYGIAITGGVLWIIFG
ncbi:hypothetical protein [Evansella tamaricis]|uniref:Uncharacterized protein n=1 Tax=Evansella tamaricis TaxID=2069301 RepID=A0ABS6JC12_9BACI|nr:hypothetical protein [Evansella tamaricis]MBU9711033.1 hypothetical protein [Evansella tamaricis]